MEAGDARDLPEMKEAMTAVVELLLPEKVVKAMTMIDRAVADVVVVVAAANEIPTTTKTMVAAVEVAAGAVVVVEGVELLFDGAPVSVH